ncbi:MAG: (d)CMP kinase [Dermatophilaceae bacterium]
MSGGHTGLVVAIDGPSGSGKSTVSRAVATALGAAYLDTGAMYRALTWGCLERGVDVTDRWAVARLCAELPLEMGLDPAALWVRVDGSDVTTAIRQDRVTGAVSAVATNLEVRALLRERQRALVDQAVRHTGRVVAEGRDVTTVVAPDADVRILLTATEQARLARRAAENHGTADAATMAATHPHVVERDRVDATVADFREAAEGVVRLDTSELSFDETVAAVLTLVHRAAPTCTDGGDRGHR